MVDSDEGQGQLHATRGCVWTSQARVRAALGCKWLLDGTVAQVQGGQHGAETTTCRRVRRGPLLAATHGGAAMAVISRTPNRTCLQARRPNQPRHDRCHITTRFYSDRPCDRSRIASRNSGLVTRELMRNAKGPVTTNAQGRGVALDSRSHTLPACSSEASRHHHVNGRLGMSESDAANVSCTGTVIPPGPSVVALLQWKPAYQSPSGKSFMN